MDSMSLNTDLTSRLLGADLTKSAARQDETTPGEALNSFGDILKKSLGEVNTLQNQAAEATETYATGGPVELHQVMIAVEKAELSLELTAQIRNKMLSAYQEITRMGV